MQLQEPTAQTLQYNPWLIQRGKINPAEATGITKRFSEQVTTDYMGAAKFEFGAMAKSLRHIHAALATHPEEALHELQLGSNKLFVYAPHGAAFFKAYKRTIVALRYNNPQLKESNHFATDYKPFSTKHVTNFWWDLQHEVMWSFDRNFMENRLGDALKASFAVMKLT